MAGPGRVFHKVDKSYGSKPPDGGIEHSTAYYGDVDKPDYDPDEEEIRRDNLDESLNRNSLTMGQMGLVG